MVQMAKFSFGEDWVPKKYGIYVYIWIIHNHNFFWCTILYVYYADVVVNVPEELDLSHLRGQGLQPGEEELPEGEAPSDQASQPPGTTYHIYRLELNI